MYFSHSNYITTLSPAPIDVAHTFKTQDKAVEAWSGVILPNEKNTLSEN